MISPMEIETTLRATFCELIDDIVGTTTDPAALSLECRIAYDFGLESIELIALLDRLREQLGVRVELLGQAGTDVHQLLDRLTVGWILEQAIAHQAAVARS